MRRVLLIIITLSISVFSSFGQIPNGYYDNAEGLTGEQLRTALSGIIDNHTSKSYTYLWTAFQSTDKKTNGKVWDMYSTRADGSSDYEFTFVNDQCGNYSGESSCYNREHSFPKSWFDDDAPMYTDLYHLYPTDGYTNGKRSNYPFGEVGATSWTSTNGSKVGTCSYPGYTGTVFEPIDEFKGDFARTYFYMLTRYQNQIDTWDSPMLSGNDFSTWSKDMLLEWASQDPISQKETDRNNKVYNIQHNRNPYIDHPEYAQAVWNPDGVGIADLKNETIKVWYSNNSINWECKDLAEGELVIYSIVGDKMVSISIDSEKDTKTLNLKKGIYIADFNTDTRQVLKFVVQ